MHVEPPSSHIHTPLDTWHSKRGKFVNGLLLTEELQNNREKNLPVSVEQQLANNENKTTGNSVHLVMQLSAGAQVLISRDDMTASEKSKEAENIYCAAQQDVQKLPSWSYQGSSCVSTRGAGSSGGCSPLRWVLQNTWKPDQICATC